MRKKGNVLNAPNTLTIKEDGKIDPVNINRNTPTMRSLTQESMYSGKGAPPRGTPPEDIPGSPRTMRTLPQAPLTTKMGGYEESQPGTPRTLRKLPASIAKGEVD
jgi:hypothetical protein